MTEKLPVFTISGDNLSTVGPSFKGTDTDLDGSGVRRCLRVPENRTPNLSGRCVRQELTFQNLLIETNQTI